ncbi:hypothetical protein Q7A53_05295 [Halobacillus rhizosphaerae]|uniref:hypothetical protein n=1 Tax=Halobacillus rhizosphaerae TaxID=3064889 RepID=UPI00398A850F
MKVVIDKEVSSQEEAVEGIEFDIGENHVYITINHNYVRIAKDDLQKLVKLL